MSISRRTFSTAIVATTAGAALGTSTAVLAQAPAFPTKPVTVLVGYAPGGPTDIYVRSLAKHLSDLWKQPVIVENRAGASGSIAAQQVLKAPADGYTLLFTNNAANGAYEVLSPKTATYRTLRDFKAVALFGISPSMMVVRATLPVKDAREFVAYAKANPGKVTYGSSAVGSAPHLASELLQNVAGIKMLHVPYNGAAPIIQALLGDTVDMYIGGASTVMGQVRAGKLRAIGAVHPTRLQSAPEVPTMGEQGFKGVEYASWFGMLASAQVPDALLDQINADCRKVMELPEMKAQLQTFGIEYSSYTRPQFLQVVKEEVERSSKVVSEGKISLE
ncbi:MAG: tripartite tricarboxylate transporter substrate binding protein [Comamonadaceae bacterium]|nr:MAG: tripartite tricarboxylate transporter substrate binding protein [Comamonadaceae bacterium]